MSNNYIRYPKTHTARSKELGRESVCIGILGPKGRFEAMMHMDENTATFLWVFARELNRNQFEGKTPADAFKATESKIAEFRKAKSDG